MADNDYINSRIFLRLLRPLAFGVSCFGVYAGAVNLGITDFIFGIPFGAVTLYFAYKNQGAYLILALVLICICLPLYILKQTQGKLFHPIVGKTIYPDQDLCMVLSPYEYDDEYKPRVFNDMDPLESCSENSDPPGYILSKDKGLVVERVSVVHSGIGEEHYTAWLRFDSGIVRFRVGWSEVAFRFKNGSTVRVSDTWRPIFYYPPYILYYPFYLFG